MTREEAKQKIYNASKEDRSSPKNCIHLLYLHGFIDQIFDEHGEQLQDKDDEIDVLKHRVEEAQEPKNCDGCKHKPTDGECYYEPCGTCARFFYDHYEPKATT